MVEKIGKVMSGSGDGDKEATIERGKGRGKGEVLLIKMMEKVGRVN